MKRRNLSLALATSPLAAALRGLLGRLPGSVPAGPLAGRPDGPLAALRAVPAAGPVLLGGCGVGGEGTGGIATTRSAVVGRVEGLGGLRIAGTLLDDTPARLFVEWDPREPVERPLADLRLGMVALADSDAGGVTRLEVAPEVVGPVQQVQAALRQCVIAGQTVLLDALPADPTVLEGFGTLADLRPGQRLEVHGERDLSNRVRASRIVRLGADAAGVRVAGWVEAVDSASASVRIGALEIVTGGAPAPALGTRAVAFGAALEPDGRLRALVLRSAPALAAGAGTARVAGAAARWQAGARFALRGFVVDASALALTESQQAALAAGRLVIVAGPVESGLLRARDIVFPDESAAAEAEVAAPLSERVDERRFALRGTPVDAADARFAALTPANLANGVPVVVRGRLGGSGIRASEVAARIPADTVFVQAGSVSVLDRGARTLRIEGLAAGFGWSAATVFEGGSEADLAAGRAIEVRGRQAGAQFTIDRLRLAPAQAPIELSGIAGNVEAAGAGGEFEIGPVDMVWTPATRFLGLTNTAADLVDGRVIRVSGVLEGAVVRALSVDTRATQPGAVRIRGTVGRFVSAAEFRVDGQQVNAAGASFDPPGLRNALPGAYVDVEGTLNAGVLVASRVSDP